MDIEKLKTGDYKKNEALEALLGKLNFYLKDVKRHTSSAHAEAANFPILFIVGVPRSGTTLLSQWMASTGAFCYPSNFMSRFYTAPYVGALIQELIFNPQYNYKDELNLAAPAISFRSDVGKTKGVLEPHEFWYFWRRFFYFSDIPVAEEVFLQNANFALFLNEVNELTDIYKKPFFLKSLIINPYISAFVKNIKNAVFLYIRRDPLLNMRSLLNTRVKYFNDEKVWFSFKPHEFARLEGLSPYLQVAGQVYYLNKRLEEQFLQIPTQNKLIVDYEDFCANPAATYSGLNNILRDHGVYLSEDYTGNKKFTTEKTELQEEDRAKLWEAYQIIERL